MKILNNQETYGKEPQILGESWVTTRFEDLEDWAQRNSFWPFPFGTACCAIEFRNSCMLKPSEENKRAIRAPNEGESIRTQG